jgi:hypothetical protein
LTADVGEDFRRRTIAAFHEDRARREETERALAEAAGIAPHRIAIYCPSFGMSLPEAEVPARMEDGRVLPLSESNNAEIRILKEKHKALWRFLVLIDRSVWDRRDAVARAAAERIGGAEIERR